MTAVEKGTLLKFKKLLVLVAMAEGWFVLQVNRLNAKIEKPPGVTHVADDKYYYVRIQKHPLEAVEEAQMMARGGGLPPVCMADGGPTAPRQQNFHEVPFYGVSQPKLSLQL